jgi:cell division protein ZapA (FtsZ GTPase activity inhibitor)
MTKETGVVQVEIFGQVYSLRSDGDPSYIQSLASYVDARMRDVAKQTRAVDSLRVAILTALNIADEKARSSGAAAPSAPLGAAPASPSMTAEVEKRADEWSRLLDEALAS